MIKEGRPNIKKDFEELLSGRALTMEMDEQIVYNQLFTKKNAVWSLLLARGYLKVVRKIFVEGTGAYNMNLLSSTKKCTLCLKI